MQRFFISILLCFLSAIGADWKFIGFKSGTTELIFYDQDGIDLLPNGNVKVWMENTETGNDTSVWNKAVEQITKGYRPPCFKVLMNLSEKPENLLEITVWEMMACKQMLKCKYRMLTELNMKTKMYRILSATLYKPDGTIVNIPEGAWDYIVPETNTETLYSLLKLRKPNTKKP